MAEYRKRLRGLVLDWSDDFLLSLSLKSEDLILKLTQATRLDGARTASFSGVPRGHQLTSEERANGMRSDMYLFYITNLPRLVRYTLGNTRHSLLLVCYKW